VCGPRCVAQTFIRRWPRSAYAVRTCFNFIERAVRTLIHSGIHHHRSARYSKCAPKQCLNSRDSPYQWLEPRLPNSLSSLHIKAPHQRNLPPLSTLIIRITCCPARDWTASSSENQHGAGQAFLKGPTRTKL
jgi:hypothetical protein